MNDFQKASRLFEDRVDRDDYFEAASSELSKMTLLGLINESERKPVFLLGDPGVGKTKMLHTIKNALWESGDDRIVIHLNEPFSDPVSFLRHLLKASGVDERGEPEELKKRAADHFREHEHLIMIDEAQLMDESSFEFLRILSDTKAFRLLLSMHKEEGEAILEKPHFKSRSHRVVEIGRLDAVEVGEYLTTTLLKEGLGEIATMIDKKSAKRIHRYSAGNFRHVKRMAQVLFELMGYAKSNGMKRYRTLNRCLLDMAAIDLGLIDA
ncbi:ATP-binding protein [Hydrogenimonas urashimensis]|uniref:ATP-binding protein n=1 Tax=Hydrogenimonas urashimensis TaxID=2740515 RepID=UPI001916467F|nr:ATP-binding protein [Hydrogenimonas urashimensis]